MTTEKHFTDIAKSALYNRPDDRLKEWEDEVRQVDAAIQSLGIPRTLQAALFAGIDRKEETMNRLIKATLRDESIETIYAAAQSYAKLLSKEW